MSDTKPTKFTFTVGKLDAGIAILIGERASLIEFPSLLLPRGVTLGSVVDIQVTRNEADQQKKREEFIGLQDEILQVYGVNSPSPPVLRIRSVTQTTLTLEWDRLNLATADLFSLDVIRNGERIAKVPFPKTSTTTKLSGLSMDTQYTLELIMYTSAGTYASEEVTVRTHTIDDLHGIHVCLGPIAEARLAEATKKVIEAIGASWTTQVQIDTTHLLCTKPPSSSDEEQKKAYEKALNLSLPIVQPHWLFACQEQKRMVNISAFYLDSMPPNALQVQDQVSAMLGTPPDATSEHAHRVEPKAHQAEASDNDDAEPDASRAKEGRVQEKDVNDDANHDAKDGDDVIDDAEDEDDVKDADDANDNDANDNDANDNDVNDNADVTAMLPPSLPPKEENWEAAVPSTTAAHDHDNTDDQLGAEMENIDLN